MGSMRGRSTHNKICCSSNRYTSSIAAGFHFFYHNHEKNKHEKLYFFFFFGRVDEYFLSPFCLFGVYPKIPRDFAPPVILNDVESDALNAQPLFFVIKVGTICYLLACILCLIFIDAIEQNGEKFYTIRSHDIHLLITAVKQCSENQLKPVNSHIEVKIK